jgi:hypothetical protein
VHSSRRSGVCERWWSEGGVWCGQLTLGRAQLGFGEVQMAVQCFTEVRTKSLCS